MLRKTIYLLVFCLALSCTKSSDPEPKIKNPNYDLLISIEASAKNFFHSKVKRSSLFDSLRLNAENLCWDKRRIYFNNKNQRMLSVYFNNKSKQKEIYSLVFIYSQSNPIDSYIVKYESNQEYDLEQHDILRYELFTGVMKTYNLHGNPLYSIQFENGDIINNTFFYKM